MQDDPTLGRFITEDPIKDGTNWHIYVNNNPINYTDPTGLRVIKDNDENGDPILVNPIITNPLQYLINIRNRFKGESGKLFIDEPYDSYTFSVGYFEENDSLGLTNKAEFYLSHGGGYSLLPNGFANLEFGYSKTNADTLIDRKSLDLDLWFSVLGGSVIMNDNRPYALELSLGWSPVLLTTLGI